MQTCRERVALLAGCALLAAFAAAPLGAQGHLVGQVRDSTGRGLSGAQIVLEGTATETRTDSVGTFRLVMPAATYALLVRHVGYRALRRELTLVNGDTVRALLTLAAAETPELDPVTVRGDRDYVPGRAGFAYRRRLGFGTFMDSVELRKDDGRTLSNVLRRVPGLKIVLAATRSSMAGSPKEYAAHPVGGCFVAVMLDNVFIYRGLRGEEPPDLRKDIQVMDLEAIEYYRGGGPLPPEFSIRHADCGVLVLWTRRGKVGR